MALMDFSLGDIGGLFTGLREAITGEKIEDPVELAKIDLQLQELERLANAGQMEVNKVEAAHKSIFVAGWRPWLGWVCGMSIAYSFIGQPLLEWGLVFFDHQIAVKTVIDGSIVWSEGIKVPQIDSENLMELTLGMLGLAGLRTYEKTKGVSRER